MIARMNTHGVVICCGIMSGKGFRFRHVLCVNVSPGYGDKKGMAAVSNYGLVLMNRLRIQGFSVIDHVAQFEESTKALADAVKSGKLIVEGAETVVDVSGRFEEIPKVWTGLFEGANTGKLISKLASTD